MPKILKNNKKQQKIQSIKEISISTIVSIIGACTLGIGLAVWWIRRKLGHKIKGKAKQWESQLSEPPAKFVEKIIQRASRIGFPSIESKQEEVIALRELPPLPKCPPPVQPNVTQGKKAAPRPPSYLDRIASIS